MSLPPDTHNEKVAVALSGGVDSAVSAALMKERGAQVIGLTMLLQREDLPDDAARVARFLGIEHHIVDLTDLFEREVMQRFADDYVRGVTPVPCAVCNRLIKFGALIDVAREKGASSLVTGHYARRVEAEAGAQIHMAADLHKDQSYFLFGLTKQQIAFARFPLGEMTKEETRNIASRFDLPVAQKKDSQDICFVPCGDYASIVQKLRPDAKRSGNIVDQEGNILGTHAGIVNFTVGQRKGLNLSDRKGDHNEPLFVLSLDADRAQVVVGPREALAAKNVRLSDVNWLGDNLPSSAHPYGVRLRSSQKIQPAMVALAHEGACGLTAKVELADPVYGVAKGQAGVIYDGTRLLGGGWIS